MKPFLILGLGNPLRGDDGVGCRVAQALERRVLPQDVEVMEGGTPGLGLIHLLEGRTRVFLVDAAEMDRPAGTVMQFHAQDATLISPAASFSLHDSDVAGALNLACALQIPMPEIVFFGVQPACLDWGRGLSPQVQAAIPKVVAAVLTAVEDSAGQARSRRIPLGESTQEPGADHGQ
jgi:hydrogenase maturation protease